MGANVASCTHVTVAADEHYIIREQDGGVEVIEGPAQIAKWGRSFEKVQPVTASEDQYLRIKKKSGLTEFQPGPVSVVRNPLDHIEVQVGEVTKLAKGSVLLVYRETEAGRIERTLLEGPCTYMPRCAMEWTKPVATTIAGQGQYLTVHHLDGHVEYVVGPASMHVDPEKYREIAVENAVQIGDQELVVVYRHASSTGHEAGSGGGAIQVNRHIIRGPCMYIPETRSEWMHQFSWTANADRSSDVSGPQRKQVDALKFTKLRACPGKTYYDVESVRTKDNALITIKLMLFFRYESVETMLDNTNDPPADLINAATADVIDWCSPKKFDEFLMSTEQLNSLSAYAQLQVAAAKIGMAIDKVVFRGYNAPASLQAMHDKAIETRTAMNLARESQEEEQNLLDFKLQKEQERSEKQHQFELEALTHELALKAKNKEAEINRLKEERTLDLDKLREIKQIDPNFDVGKYLVAKDSQPSVVQCSTLMTSPGTSIADAETRSNTTMSRQ